MLLTTGGNAAQLLAGRGDDCEHDVRQVETGQPGENLFESPAFSTWVPYVTKLDAQNAGDLMLAALKTSYTDDALANLLVATTTRRSLPTNSRELNAKIGLTMRSPQMTFSSY